MWFALAYKAEVTSEPRLQKTIHALKLFSAHEGGPGLVCWRTEFPNQLPDMHLRLSERHLKPPQTIETPVHLSADCRQTNKPSPGQNSGHRDLWAIIHAYCLKLLSYRLIHYAATMDVLSWSDLIAATYFYHSPLYHYIASCVSLPQMFKLFKNRTNFYFAPQNLTAPANFSINERQKNINDN